MKHELQIHTKAVYAQMSDFYEVCSLIVALLIPVEPQTSDTQLSLLSYRLTFFWFRHFRIHQGSQLSHDQTIPNQIKPFKALF